MSPRETIEPDPPVVVALRKLCANQEPVLDPLDYWALEAFFTPEARVMRPGCEVFVTDFGVLTYASPAAMSAPHMIVSKSANGMQRSRWPRSAKVAVVRKVVWA